MRSEAIHALMAIAQDEATEDDHQAFDVTVRNSEGAVYHATVSLEGGIDRDKASTVVEMVRHH